MDYHSFEFYLFLADLLFPSVLDFDSLGCLHLQVVGLVILLWLAVQGVKPKTKLIVITRDNFRTSIAFFFAVFSDWLTPAS